MQKITFEDLPSTNTPLNANNLNTLQDNVEDAINNILLNIYPVGSIYMSINNTNPSTLFGGTWEQIQDTFLLSAGSTYTAGATGGSATHTLTVNEIPSHHHNLPTGYSGGTWSGGHYGFPANVGNDGTSHVFYNGTSDTGGGQAFSTMPPYLVVYMWKRTA